MGEMFRQLGHLFLQTVPTVLFVFLLFVILDRIFFRPLSAVLKRREELTLGALARAREQAAAADSKTREYVAAFQAARQEVYRQLEAERGASLAEREAALQNARGQAEAMIRKARAQLAEEAARVKVELERACRPLAEKISQSLVGPASPTGKAGGARL
jgi:F0F1-type ATP synthase membrane subunit b/b'